MSSLERRQADLFFADLVGEPLFGSARESDEGDEGSTPLETFDDMLEAAPGAGMAEASSACPPPGPLPSRCTGIRVPEVLTCFGLNSHAVLPIHQPKIVQIARCTLASQRTSTPITTLRIVGHTDASGDPSVNDPLGKRRAEAVKDAIESTLSRMTGGRPPRLTITTDTQGERRTVSGPAELSRRVEVFPPFAFPVVTPPRPVCPTDFDVAPASPITLEAGTTTVLRASDRQSTGPAAPTFTWRTTSANLALAGASASPQVVTGSSVAVRALPDALSTATEVVEVTRTQPSCAPVTKQVRVTIPCERFILRSPKIIARAIDKTITPVTTFTDPAVLGGTVLTFGQDMTFATGRAQPHGPSQGTTTSVLDAKMRKLLTEFAANDPHGKAKRLFDAFLVPNTAVRFWTDPDLTAAAEAHPNTVSFIHRALNAPSSPERSPGQTRIHQALEAAGWDINAAVPPTDLGVPAFNRGSDLRRTEDWGNGLKVMINGVQHVIVVAKEYRFDACARQYTIKLEYILYDVFGLDDDDLREFGADGGIDTDASEGITAWWQLQHQHDYAPLITRMAFERTFTVSVP